MTAEERAHGWTRVNYVMELVKNEGDAECEAAFDFLLAERRLSIAETRESCAKILDPLGCSDACGAEHSGSCYTMLAAEMRAQAVA